MNTPTPQEMLAKVKQSRYRGQILGWAVGTLLALFGLGWAVSPSLSLGRASTEGTVIKLEPEIELISHGNPQAGEMVWHEQVVVSYPVVEYQVGDRKYTYRPRSSFRTYTVGEKVPVLYKVDRPGVARIDSFSDRWLFPLMFGSLFVVLGVAIVVATVYWKRMLLKIEASLTPEVDAVERPKGSSQSESN